MDSSALIAILEKEPEASRLLAAIFAHDHRFISAATVLESGIVAERRGQENGSAELDKPIDQLELKIIAFTREQAAIAREAFRRFGKGRHPAQLNFGDCFSYALARERGEPLLFKGGDFSHTDIEPALS